MPQCPFCDETVGPNDYVLGIGSVGLLLASIPPAAFLSKPVSGLGLAVGLLASVVPALVRQTELRFPLAMSGLCLLTLLLAGDWPHEPPPPPPPVVAFPLGD